MSGIHPECLDSDPSDWSVAADVLLRQEPDEGGDVRHKQQELAIARNEKMDTCTFDALSVRIHGDSAVVVGRYSLSGTNAGQPFSETGVSTDMWAKRGGKWLLVGTQNTSVPATSHSAADDTKEMLKSKRTC